jgi:putative DNA primase/helicase
MNNDLGTLTRKALAAAIHATPQRRQKLFSFLPSDTWKGPALYYNLGRFFAKDTTSEGFGDVAKASGLDPVAIMELDDGNEIFTSLAPYLVRLLSARQTAAQADGQDVTKWASAISEISAAATTPTEQVENRIKIIDALDFMAMDFPPRENIFSPWLPRQGLTMVYAPRGIGKTHVSLGIGYAVTSAGSFLGWHAETPRNVLFVDGEMPAVVLQERIARIAASNDKEPAAQFRIYTPDMQPNGMINLSCPIDQAALEPFLEGIDLIILDNLSTLCRSGRENEGEAWLPVQQWALQQRAAGRSVLFIHHAGKNGEQRGSSRREDVLDTVISLKRPGDYTPDMGACFEVHFEKARGLYGDDTKPFEARLMTESDNTQTWALQPLENSTAEKVAALLNDGIPQSEIPELLGMTRGAISKAKKKAAEMGILKGVS